ncbi:MAG: hypothetical protein JOZ66_06055, partial [Hyphomicrobiales bacterium]|nr:hypothetical protein [Hyphomicrobiales bacterium]
HIGAAHTPFSARMRNGFVLPPMAGEVDWTERLQVGEAGLREGSNIISRKEMVGAVVRGPYRHLHAGTYRFKLRVSENRSSRRDDDYPVAVLEIVSRREFLGHRLVDLSDLAKGEVELDVDVTADQSLSPGFSVETRLRTLVPVELTISALSCERVSDVKTAKPSETRALSVKEWLPLLWAGPATRRRNGYMFHGSAKPGIVFFGPYWRVPEGRYEAVFHLEAEAASWTLEALMRGYARALGSALRALWRRYRGISIGSHGGHYPLCTFQAISHDTELASKVLFITNWRSKKELTLPFTVPGSLSRNPDFGLEFRLLAHGQLPFGFKSITVRRMAI